MHKRSRGCVFSSRKKRIYVGKAGRFVLFVFFLWSERSGNLWGRGVCRRGSKPREGYAPPPPLVFQNLGKRAPLGGKGGKRGEMQNLPLSELRSFNLPPPPPPPRRRRRHPFPKLCKPHRAAQKSEILFPSSSPKTPTNLHRRRI